MRVMVTRTPGVAMGCTVSTGLTIGQAVWYDIRLAALAGGTATATNVVLTAVELP